MLKRGLKLLTAQQGLIKAVQEAQVVGAYSKFQQSMSFSAPAKADANIPVVNKLPPLTEEQRLTFIETGYGYVNFYRPWGEPKPLEFIEELFDHQTGIERIEMEHYQKGEDIWGETWVYGPWGTPENPKEVPSFSSDRIIGAPDPDEEAQLQWHILREGDPPTQLVRGGEFFVLKKVQAPDWAYID